MSNKKFPVNVIKSKIRANALAIRLELPPNSGSKAAVKLKDIFWEKLGADIKKIKKEKGKCIISVYIPMQGEINPEPLMNKLKERGFDLALPVVKKENEPLIFRKIDADIEFEEGILGTKHPSRGDEIIPDVMIIPMLAFDKNCYRLGFGGGYYDKTIDLFEKMDKRPICYGIAYSKQEIDVVPVEEHDKRLDAVITEKFIYKSGV